MFPPDLTYALQILPCGYSPRTIHLSCSNRDVLFIGCRDGSVWITERDHEAVDRTKPFRSRQLTPEPPREGKYPSRVRTLCECRNGLLFVGRDNGSVDVVDWTKNGRPHSFWPLGKPVDEPVILIDQVQGKRLLVSYRNRGTCLLDLPKSGGAKKIAKVLPSAGGRRFLKDSDGRPIHSVGLVTRLLERGRDRELFLLVTDQGHLLSWDGEGPAERRDDLWSEGDRPVFVNDYALWRGEEQRRNRSAKGVLLATDSGIFLLIRDEGKLTHPCRLSIHGLDSTCTALTYAEDREHRFLWAVTSKGQTHVYCDVIPDARYLRSGRRDSLNFRPSGYFHAGSQALVGFSWPSHEQKSTLIFGHARRDNQVAIGIYRPTDESPLGPRRLLSVGEPAAIRTYIAEREANRRRHEQPADAAPTLDDWPDYALLAELFESLAEDSETRGALVEFVSNPTPDVALGVLRGTPSPKECGVAIELWTMALLNVTNRYFADDAERFGTGVLRWLSQIQDRCGTDARFQEPRKEILAAIEISQRLIRKWAVSAHSTTARLVLSRPIDMFRRQDQKSQGLDRLTYESLLFNRGVDVLQEESSGEMSGRKCWDISLLLQGGRSWVAVSWKWGGVEVFELEKTPLRFDLQTAVIPVPNEDGETFSLKCHDFERDEPRIRANIHRSKYGHSRSIHLGRRGEATYLLTTLARQVQEEGAAESEQLYCWRLPVGGERLSLGDVEPSTLRLQSGESAWTLLEVEPGWVVVGLRARSPHPRLLLVEIDADLRLIRRGYLDITTSGLQQQASAQNRVRSLAKPWTAAPATSANGEGELRIVVGCDDGHIWRVCWSRPRRELAPGEHVWGQKGSQGGTERQDHRFELVHRMSSPVVALAYREDYAQTVLSRVFAGCIDGSIVAWQELPDEERSRPVFASAWATSEAGAVCDFHLLPLANQGEDPTAGEIEDEPPVIVMAVTRNGFLVLFDDRTKASHSFSRNRVLQRRAFPGCRHGRFRLGSSMFASLVLDEEQLGLNLPGEAGELQRYGVLVGATDRGVLRLLGLHHPHYSKHRQRTYEDLIRLWWKLTSKDNLHYVRIADGAFRAAPVLPLLLVRWLLHVPDSMESRVLAEAECRHAAPGFLKPWHLPRYLRPVLALRRAWEARDPEAVQLHVDAALAYAHGLKDVRLFQEICAATLKWANRDILAAEEGGIASIQSVYFAAFNAMEHALERWQGAAGQAESRVRMVAAKNLVDGETFHRILREANPHGSPAQKAFGEILAKRINGVHQLIFKRDPLVSLESLRAANLSLARVCLRLVSEHGKAGAKSRFGGDFEIPWATFEAYFNELALAAAQTFQAPPRLSDALAHEFARTFALAVCTCPSGAIRIANRMTETRLITDLDSNEDLSRKVQLQFEILGSVGLPVPKEAQRLFRLVTSPPSAKEWNPIFEVLHENRVFKIVGKPGSAGSAVLLRDLRAKFGTQNAEDLICLAQVDLAARWIEETARALSSEASRLDLSKATLEKAEQALKLDHTSSSDPYEHTRGFWKTALESLRKKLKGGIEQSATIRPEILLTARGLEAWAAARLDDLDERYRNLQIFQPELAIFKAVLTRLQLAAKAFPSSAAAQKAVVAGILGHHLVEELDELALELEELAHSLDPLLVARFRGDSRRPVQVEKDLPVAQQFAAYLLRRSGSAQSVPKNLRILTELLESGPEPETEPLDSPSELATQGEELGLHELLQRFKATGHQEWDVTGVPKGWGPTLSGKEQTHLELILGELHQNQVKHAEGGGAAEAPKSKSKQPPLAQPKVTRLLPSGIRLTFKFRLVGKNLQRLEHLQNTGLQEPTDPNTNRLVASSGTGLYLANLAAAVVNWKLELKVRGYKHTGVVAFKLYKNASDAERQDGHA